MSSDTKIQNIYEETSGSVFLTGTQALVMSSLLQGRRDKILGINSGGMISGYRGSPLSTLDQDFKRAQEYLDIFNIKFQGGVNEDLAATILWGTQNVGMDPNASVDGVFSMWYGKGAGLDRCVDVMRHANSAGSSKHGGVLVVSGDDHALKSSAQAHHCEPTFEDMRIPVLYPSNIEEILEYALYGWALSRDSGCWVGFKTLPETVNTAATVTLPDPAMEIVLPGKDASQQNRYIQWPDPWPEGEKRFYKLKLPRIHAFNRLNRLDRIIFKSDNPKVGIVTTGKSYWDTLEAIRLLGMSPEQASEAGLSLYKVAMPWPLEPEGIQQFSKGLNTVIVIEEKRDTIERQVKTQLFDAKIALSVMGKKDLENNTLFPETGELTPQLIALGLAQIIPGFSANPTVQARAKALADRQNNVQSAAPLVVRPPFFCSGCPHNTSTKVPVGSKAMAGIGCHGMAMFDPSGDTATHTHMGGEGVTWIGQAPFTKTQHMFQNMGEGTYHHSGIMAIRAAISAQVNITYKILFNDAVAMTGGQSIDGRLTVPQLIQQLRAEGVKNLCVITDDINKYQKEIDADIHPREQLDSIQRKYRDTPGVTAIIYDQVCATEKRRRRKRGLLPEPNRRVFINDTICEGCGDCGEKSNCLSVIPLETEFGRKRAIDQSACNKDYSCVKGFCPSFVYVDDARLKNHSNEIKHGIAFDDVPSPTIPYIPDEQPFSILLTGIGGNGIATIGGLLGMAAAIDGKSCQVHDKLGMAQKFGAVASQVRIAKDKNTVFAPRIPAQSADAVIAGDFIVTSQQDVLELIKPDHTKIVLNTEESITGEFAKNADFEFRKDEIISRIQAFSGAKKINMINATQIATVVAGDAIGASMFLLGYSFQKGLIPISLNAIITAIKNHGVAAEKNITTFAWGRLTAENPDSVKKSTENHIPEIRFPKNAPSVNEVLERRSSFLADYQNDAYANKYRALVNKVAEFENRCFPEQTALTKAVARYYFKLLTYKDEYEVARLHSHPDFRKKLDAQFEKGYKLTYLLAPPLLSRKDPHSGEPGKIAFGPWVQPIFRILAKFKFLRGTFLDIFGFTSERRMERKLITNYEQDVIDTLSNVSENTYETAVKLLNLPEHIRGYGHVKLKSIDNYREKRKSLINEIKGAKITMHSIN